MATRATPTKLLLKEYFNYTLMIGAGMASLSVAYAGYTGDWPKASTVVSLGGLAASLPAAGLALNSLGKMLGVARPTTMRHSIVAGGGFAPIEREVNGVKAFFSRVPFAPADVVARRSQDSAFDPNIRTDPDVRSRTIRYKEQAPQLRWWQVDVLRRADRPTIITVRLYEDLVMAIIEKGWRAQRNNKAHPISQRYLCSLHYEALSGQRLDDVTYLAFVKLGLQYQLFTGARRQGTSGKLAGSPIWCRRQLGLSV